MFTRAKYDTVCFSTFIWSIDDSNYSIEVRAKPDFEKIGAKEPIWQKKSDLVQKKKALNLIGRGVFVNSWDTISCVKTGFWKRMAPWLYAKK